MESWYVARPRKVLMAVNLGVDEGRLEVGSTWARGLGAELAACHVLPSSGDVERATAALRARVSPAAGVEVIVESGEPRRKLVEAAEALGADLLVVGAEPGRLGDVPAGVLASAHCNVLVARRALGSGPIVVGCDFSQPALGAVAAARAIARLQGVRVAVVHSIEDVAEDERAAAVAARLHAAREAVSAAAGPDVEVHVTTARPALALLSAERELRASALVLGACGASRLPRRPLGSVAAAVAGAAEGPVLLVRAVTGVCA